MLKSTRVPLSASRASTLLLLQYRGEDCHSHLFQGPESSTQLNTEGTKHSDKCYSTHPISKGRRVHYGFLHKFPVKLRHGVAGSTQCSKFNSRTSSQLSLVFLGETCPSPWPSAGIPSCEAQLLLFIKSPWCSRSCLGKSEVSQMQTAHECQSPVDMVPLCPTLFVATSFLSSPKR